MFKQIIGIMIMSFSLFAMLEAKSIVVGEKIITNNPWRNELIKKEYDLAIEQALKEHKVKYSKSTVTITRSFDDGPIQGFSVAEKSGALGVAGYLYSSDAFEASELAKNKKIPYLSPVSPLTTIRNDFAFSLAASHEDLKESFGKLSKKLSYPSVIILPETFLTNFEYKRIIRDRDFLFLPAKL